MVSCNSQSQRLLDRFNKVQFLGTCRNCINWSFIILFIIIHIIVLQPKELEKLEEAKLKAKFPNAMLGRGGPGGHSAFLQKRLAKGVCMIVQFFFINTCQIDCTLTNGRYA